MGASVFRFVRQRYDSEAKGEENRPLRNFAFDESTWAGLAGAFAAIPVVGPFVHSLCIFDLVNNPISQQTGIPMVESYSDLGRGLTALIGTGANLMGSIALGGAALGATAAALPIAAACLGASAVTGAFLAALPTDSKSKPASPQLPM